MKTPAFKCWHSGKVCHSLKYQSRELTWQMHVYLIFSKIIILYPIQGPVLGGNVMSTETEYLVLSHLGLAFVLMLRPFFPELVMSTDLLSFEHPSVLLFCFFHKIIDIMFSHTIIITSQTILLCSFTTILCSNLGLTHFSVPGSNQRKYISKR